MLVIGDSLVKDVAQATSFPGMKLSEYIHVQLDVGEEPIVVYSFGCNDLNAGATFAETFANYNCLRRGAEATYLIVPPGQPQFVYDHFSDSALLDDDFTLVCTWCREYTTTDGLHPNEAAIRRLERDLRDDCTTTTSSTSTTGKT